MALTFLINIFHLIIDTFVLLVLKLTSDAGIWLSLKYLANIEFQTLFYYKTSPDTVSDINMHTLFIMFFFLNLPELYVFDLRLYNRLTGYLQANS